MQGQPGVAWLTGICEPVAGLWKARPLQNEVVAMANGRILTAARSATVPEVLRVLADVRRIALEATDFDIAITQTRASGNDVATASALTGLLFGLRHGFASLPAERCQALRGKEQLDAVVQRFLARNAGPAGKR